MTFSSVVKWRAVRRLRLIVDGASVTEAAIGGGSFDGPHFTRACNEMLGLPPKLLDVGLVRPAEARAPDSAKPGSPSGDDDDTVLEPEPRPARLGAPRCHPRPGSPRHRLMPLDRHAS